MSPTAIMEKEDSEQEIDTKQEIKTESNVKEQKIIEPERSPEVNPASYTYRDLLLLTQILHVKNLLETDQVRRSKKLDEFGQTWFEHKSTVLSRRQEEFSLARAPTGSEIRQLYANMLVDYSPCKNTTELANCFYNLRINELKQKISDEKATFETLHNIA